MVPLSDNASSVLVITVSALIALPVENTWKNRGEGSRFDAGKYRRPAPKNDVDGGSRFGRFAGIARRPNQIYAATVS
jgi:hypothetical protein